MSVSRVFKIFCAPLRSEGVTTSNGALFVTHIDGRPAMWRHQPRSPPSPGKMSSLAQRALAAVCEYDIDRRKHLRPGVFGDKDLVRLVSTQRSTARKFGGYALSRGFNASVTLEGIVASQALVLAQRDPCTLSSSIVAHVKAGAALEARAGAFIDPDGMHALAISHPEAARKFATVDNAAQFVRRTHASSASDPQQQEICLFAAVAAIRASGSLASSSPRALCEAFGPRVLRADIAVCVRDVHAATELFVCAAEHRDSWAETMWGFADDVARNLRNVRGLDVETLYQSPVEDEDAGFLLWCIVRHLEPQPLPSKSVLERVSDTDKVMLVDNRVWRAESFDDILAMEFTDPHRVILAASGVDIPKTWFVAHAKTASRTRATGRVVPRRVAALRWPILGIWGIAGIPLQEACQIFGEIVAEVIRIAPDIIDIAHQTLRDTFQMLAEHEHLSPEGQPELPTMLATGMCHFAQTRGTLFRSADVRDACKRTNVGRALVRAGKVNMIRLVHPSEATFVSLSDVQDFCKTVAMRKAAVLWLMENGASFGVADLAPLLKTHITRVVASGAVSRASPREVVAVCRSLAKRNDERASGCRILEFLKAIATGMRHDVLRAMDRSHVAAICALVQTQQYRNVHELIQGRLVT